jgi:Rho GTPase-activating protein 39
MRGSAKSRSGTNTAPPSPNSATKPAMRRSFSSDQYHQNTVRSRQSGHGLEPGFNVQLPPIPGSPYGTEVGTPPGTPKSRKSMSSNMVNGQSGYKPGGSPNGRTPTPTPPPATTNRENAQQQQQPPTPTTPTRNRSKSSSYVPHRSPPPQSLNAAVEMISQSDTNSNNHASSHTNPNNTSISTKRSASDSGHGRPSNASVAIDIPDVPRLNINGRPGTPTRTHIRIDVGSPGKGQWPAGKRDVPPSPQRPIPAVPTRFGVLGKDISGPVLNHGELFGIIYRVIS